MAVSSAEVVVVEVGEQYVVQFVVARPGLALEYVAADEFAVVEAADAGGRIPAGAYSGVGHAVYSARGYAGAGCVDKHLGSVGEDEKNALSGRGVHEMYVELPLDPCRKYCSQFEVRGVTAFLLPAAGLDDNRLFRILLHAEAGEGGAKSQCSYQID